MQHFVNRNSIVRQIWGKADTVLFIFAGASAEFALNKAVDWLYFTGKLPQDPLGRLFSTVEYARMIVFSPEEKAFAAIDKMRAIHTSVETKRGTTIPDWAYRDVLFMLIDYSIRAYEVLERKLADEEKEEIFNVFFRVGSRMEIAGLPQSHTEWVKMRQSHLENNLEYSHFTKDLFIQYKKHLGRFRFILLKKVQSLVTPALVKDKLNLRKSSLIRLILACYKRSKPLNLDKPLKRLIMPAAFREQINRLDIVTEY